MTSTQQYASAGSYAVIITVTDSEGLIHQTIETNTVSSVILDSDGDGAGDNADAFPYDPSKQTSLAPIFETVSVSVVDSITGAPVAGASVSLQIPSSTDANFSYYMANYAVQLPVVVNGQTNMGGKLTYFRCGCRGSLDDGARGGDVY